MSRRSLLGSTSLADRFPTVMRLLTGSSAADEQPGDEPTDPPQDPPGDPADEPTDPPADGPADEPTDPVEEPAEEPGAAVPPTNNAALLAAFERDANALVAAERTRCIAVFTSDAGKRNPQGAAACLEEGLSSDRSIALLGTVSSRSLNRDRLNDTRETRVGTGRGREGADDTSSDAKTAHRKRQENRNKTAAKKGGMRPGGLPADGDD